MSLQVWLPLNGNLNNQGVSNLTFKIANSTYTTTASGKVTSNCYNNKSSTKGGIVSNETINLGSEQSMFAWVYINSINSNDACLTGLFGQHRYSTPSGMGLNLRANKIKSPSFANLSVNTVVGTTRTYTTYYGSIELYPSKWYHLGYTYDGTTIKLYVNGTVDKTITLPNMVVKDDYIHLFSWSTSSSSGNSIFDSYQFNGKLNDVRIYDNCVSAKEVKELSKGLCLHYKLSRGGENLLKNSGKYQTIRQQKSGTDGYAFYPIYYNGLDTSKTYTFSCDCNGKLSNHNTSGVNPNLKYWTIWLYEDSVVMNDTSYAHYSKATCFNLNNTTHVQIGTKHYWTFTPTYSNVSVRFNTYSDGTNLSDVTVSNIKLEEGSVCTPWIPNKSDSLYTELGYIKNIVPDVYSNEYSVSGNSKNYNEALLFYIPVSSMGVGTNGRYYKMSYEIYRDNNSSTAWPLILGDGGYSNEAVYAEHSRTTTTVNNWVSDELYIDSSINSRSGQTKYTISTYIGVYLRNASSNGSKATAKIRHIKIERADEPDCSGYGNNGIIYETSSNAITYKNDTPRYQGCSYFGFTNRITTYNMSFLNSVLITISFWAKVDSFDTSGWVVLAGQSTGYYIDADSSSGENWHSGDNAIVSKYYRDGELIASTNRTTKFISRDGAWHHYCYIATLTGWTTITVNGGALWSSSWRANVNISDFRIYTTELSANDIKALYNNPISIDDHNNLHCMELEEL